MTKKPKKKARYYQTLLNKEIEYMKATQTEVEGPTGDPKYGPNGMFQTGPTLLIPYVQLASVERQMHYIRMISRTVRELNRNKDALKKR